MSNLDVASLSQLSFSGGREGFAHPSPHQGLPLDPAGPLPPEPPLGALPPDLGPLDPRLIPLTEILDPPLHPRPRPRTLWGVLENKAQHLGAQDCLQWGPLVFYIREDTVLEYILKNIGWNLTSRESLFSPILLLWCWPWPDDLHIWTWPVFCFILLCSKQHLWRANGSSTRRGLFSHLMNTDQHVLHQLLPAQSDHHYNLRPRPHNISLSYAMDHRNFIPRLAFKDTH